MAESKSPVTDAEFEAALRESSGRLVDAAERLGLTRQAVAARVRGANAERWRAVLADIEETILDRAERSVQNAIDADPRLALRYLQTKGRGRGYVTRTEVTGKDGAALIDFEGTLAGLSDDDFARIDALRRAAREGSGPQG